jgi:hypothetical protein
VAKRGCRRANAGGKEDAVVLDSIVADGAVEPEIRMQLDVFAREGARWMLAAALRAEVAEYLEAAEGDRDEQGHALVTRTGPPGPGRS